MLNVDKSPRQSHLLSLLRVESSSNPSHVSSFLSSGLRTESFSISSIFSTYSLIYILMLWLHTDMDCRTPFKLFNMAYSRHVLRTDLRTFRSFTLERVINARLLRNPTFTNTATTRSSSLLTTTFPTCLHLALP